MRICENTGKVRKSGAAREVCALPSSNGIIQEGNPGLGKVMTGEEKRCLRNVA